MSTDYGVWKAACAWAQYAPLRHRACPRGPDLQVNDATFLPPEPLDRDPGLPDSVRGDAPAVPTHRARLLAAACWRGCWRPGGRPARRSYLYDERRRDQLPVDRTAGARGALLHPAATNDVVRPIKILFAFDASQSMPVTDPDGTRAWPRWSSCSTRCPSDPKIYFAVMLFAGSTTAFLTKSGLAEFEQLLAYTPADFTLLVDQILNFTQPQRQPGLDRLRQGAVGDLRGPQRRHPADRQRRGGRRQTDARPATSSSSSRTATPPSTRTTSCSRATRSAASASSGSWWTTSSSTPSTSSTPIAAGEQPLRPDRRRRRLSAADHQPGRASGWSRWRRSAAATSATSATTSRSTSSTSTSARCGGRTSSRTSWSVANISAAARPTRRLGRRRHATDGTA